MSEDKPAPAAQATAAAAAADDGTAARPDPTQASSPAPSLPALDELAASRFDFIIQEDGSVTFVDFPPELLDIAYALNPDDPLVCERMETLRGACTSSGDDE
ncbi:MAG: hypothetical protein CSA66_02970 [Proteobacteria bacterium]|nr:MAG: hypothetical protein CSA66_02970 [Pseudomonadota bacterium]